VDTFEDGLASNEKCEYAGSATYGEGLNQYGGCWLMSFPGADNHAAFHFFFSENATSASKAESILELLFKIIRAINDNPEEKVQTIYNLPIDDELLRTMLQ
jgi:hypothetical protein